MVNQGIMKNVSTDIFPVPSLDKEWVTNGDLALNMFASYINQNYPDKECIGFRSKLNDEGNGFVYMPVLIDKQ